MANNPNNIRLGPCRVRWGGKDLGLTKGGVDVTVKTDTKDIQVDQYGMSPVNSFITGRTLQIKCPFVETDLDTLYALMKTVGATLNDTGVAATGTITISTLPTAGSTMTINGHVFTYVAAPVPPAVLAQDTIPLAASIPATITNAVRVLRSSSDPLVNSASFTAGASTIAIVYNRSGSIGNAYTLAASSGSGTVSGATLTAGTDGSTPRNVSLTAGVGIALYSLAQQLVLHPTTKADNDYSEDFVVPLAAHPGSINFSYKVDNERIYQLDFMGFPNTSTQQLFYYGDNGTN